MRLLRAIQIYSAHTKVCATKHSDGARNDGDMKNKAHPRGVGALRPGDVGAATPGVGRITLECGGRCGERAVLKLNESLSLPLRHSAPQKF